MTTIPSTLQDYLTTRHIGFQEISGVGTGSVIQLARSQNIPFDAIAKVIMLRDHLGFVMAVCPVNCHLDLAHVKAVAGRRLEIAAQSEYCHLFTGLDPNALPPLAQAYGLSMVVDRRLNQFPYVYLQTGSSQVLLKLASADFHELTAGAQWGDIAEQMARLVPDLTVASASAYDDAEVLNLPVTALESAIDEEEIFDSVLSTLSFPLMLRELMALHKRGQLSEESLLNLVSGDPEIASLMVSFAQTPLFATPTKNTTLRDAIRALGVPLVTGLAAGLSLIRRYSMPSMGPLGQAAFWRQAIYCTATLHLMMQRRKTPVSWTWYLGALLHNFGFLLLGYLDPRRHALINQLLTRMPEHNVHEVEEMVLGESHCRLGARLMQLWDLPDEVVVAICEHHNDRYDDEHSGLANRILVANRLLKRYGIGDARKVLINSEILDRIGMDMDDLDSLIEEVLDHCRPLDTLASQLLVSGAH